MNGVLTSQHGGEIFFGVGHESYNVIVRKVTICSEREGKFINCTFFPEARVIIRGPDVEFRLCKISGENVVDPDGYGYKLIDCEPLNSTPPS
jgi:hypothetical protein